MAMRILILVWAFVFFYTGVSMADSPYVKDPRERCTLTQATEPQKGDVLKIRLTENYKVDDTRTEKEKLKGKPILLRSSTHPCVEGGEASDCETRISFEVTPNSGAESIEIPTLAKFHISRKMDTKPFSLFLYPEDEQNSIRGVTGTYARVLCETSNGGKNSRESKCSQRDIDFLFVNLSQQECYDKMKSEGEASGASRRNGAIGEP